MAPCLSDTDTDRVKDLRREGLALLKLGKYPRARRRLEQALALEPDSNRLRHDLGKVHLAADDPVAAIEALAAIPDSARHSEILWKDRALAHLANDDLQEAIECAAKALVQKPKYAAARVILARALETLGRHEAALEAYDRAIEHEPQNTEALRYKGLMLHRLGRYHDAVRCYDNLLEHRPNDAEVLQAKGLAHDALDEPGPAAEALKRGLAEEDEVIYNNRGVALTRLGQHHRAIASYRRALDINPKFANCWFNLAKALHRVGNLHEALEAFTRATDLNPRNRSAWNNCGVTLRQLDRLDESLPCYEKAIELKPDYAWAWHNKGYALELLDRPREALDCFRKAIGFKPDYTETREAIERLERRLES